MSGAREEYRIGIDPGKRYIGLAVVRIDEDDTAWPVYLDVIDLGYAKNNLSNLLAGRSSHHRARRTKKSARARMRKIKEILKHEGIPAEERDQVIALCRRRGWKPDMQATPDKSDDGDEEGSIRVHRAKVLEALEELIPKAAPSLSKAGLQNILSILDEKPNATGLNNRRVEDCGIEGCNKKRTRGTYYPVIWLSNHILTQLQPRHRETVREAFLRHLRSSGRSLESSPLSAFRRGKQKKRAYKDYELVRDAWKLAQQADPDALSEGVLDNIERFFKSARDQLKGRRTQSRLHFCPEHLLERVRCLAKGEAPPQARAKGTGHSLTWEAVQSKLNSYLYDRLKRVLPDGAEIHKVVVERAAFDLLHAKGRNIPEKRMNEARWLGPYGQLRKLYEREVGDSPTRKQLLAFELGGLCGLCGEPLGDSIDEAHLIPREEVGGYPYIAIVAAHPSCNVIMGSSTARVHPNAVEAMQDVRSRLSRVDGFVHSWIDAKKGILQALSRVDEDDSPPPVDRYLRQAFTTREATMQGSDQLGKAVVDAVNRAGFGSPDVRKQSATEIAGARWMILTQFDETAWFLKDLDKAEGEIENHAIDAFVAAALPDAQIIGYRKGERLWGIMPQDIRNRLRLLASEEAWENSTKDNVWAHGEKEASDIMSLTLRRVWRQAYARDTKMRKDYEGKGRGAYRQLAESWLSALYAKRRSKSKMQEHLANLQFTPLRDEAMEAFESAPETPKERYLTVREAIVQFLQESTLKGLEDSQPAPTEGHPVREKRIEELRNWATNGNTEDPIPPWVSVTIREDRRIQSKEQVLPVYQGTQNLESWAMRMWMLAVYEDKAATLFDILPDGRLKWKSGKKRTTKANRPSDTIKVTGVTALPPKVPEWREEIATILKSEGCNKAWIIGQGSKIVTEEIGCIWLNTKNINEYVKKESQKARHIISTTKDVRRGKLTLFTED